jgi:WhiB family transcriptional regulator, redox-sensing transcriptional regulator
MTTSPAPDDPDRSWRDNAACLDHPAGWFTDPLPGDTRRAIDVCNTCPVKRPCLEAALEIEVSADLGIWGGTTPTTRRRLRREHARNQAVPHEDSRPLPELRPAGNLTAEPGRLPLVEDDTGDLIDQSGRVIVFKIHGDPPFMLMIDGRPRARTATVDDAAGLAARLLTRAPRATGVDAGHQTLRDRPRRRT